jgi:hypothetical protein
MANSRIAVRRTATATKVPSTSDINTGELGLNMTDQIMYSHNGSVVFAIGNNLPINHVSNTLYVGNSTVNAAINSTAIVVGNSSVNTLVVNTYISGNGYGLTSITASASPGGSNTQIQFNDSATTAGDANLTWNKATASVTVGNSSINSAINSSSMSIGSVGGTINVSSSTIIVGNSTVNAVINSTSIVIGNSSVNTFVVNTYISGNGYGLTSIGGGTPGGANTQIQFNSSSTFGGDANLTWAGALCVGNSTVNVTTNTTSVRIGNSSVYTLANSTAEMFIDTATVGNCTTNSTTISVGNSLSNIIITSASAIATKNTASVYNFGAPPSKSVDVLSPASGDRYTMFWTNAAIVVAEIVTVIANSAAAWANVGFFWGANSGTSLAAINSTANSANNTTGIHITAFANATIAANSFIWANVAANSATGPLEFHATIRFV